CGQGTRRSSLRRRIGHSRPSMSEPLPFERRLGAFPLGDGHAGFRVWAPLPDPYSRWQPEGIRGPSRLLDTTTFEWSDGDWQPPAVGELVLYELHVGT